MSRLEALGFNTPTLVQHMSLGPILSGKDILLHAQTGTSENEDSLYQFPCLTRYLGSGKTLAYLLPVLASIDSTRVAVQAMVIVPTRELVSFFFFIIIKQSLQYLPFLFVIGFLYRGCRCVFSHSLYNSHSYRIHCTILSMI